MTKNVLTILLCGVLGVLAVSCYHLGTPNGTQYKVTRIEISNETKEPSAARYVLAEFHERFSVDPAYAVISGTADDTGAYTMALAVKTVKNAVSATSRVRDSKSRPSDSDEYQTTVSAVSLEVSVKVFQLGTEKVIIARTYSGTGYLSTLHDREVPLMTAYKQAARDVAMQVLDDLAVIKQ